MFDPSWCIIHIHGMTAKARRLCEGAVGHREAPGVYVCGFADAAKRAAFIADLVAVLPRKSAVRFYPFSDADYAAGGLYAGKAA